MSFKSGISYSLHKEIILVYLVSLVALAVQLGMLFATVEWANLSLMISKVISMEPLLFLISVFESILFLRKIGLNEHLQTNDMTNKQKLILGTSIVFILLRLVFAYVFKDSFFERGNRHTSINQIAMNY